MQWGEIRVSKERVRQLEKRIRQRIVDEGRKPLKPGCSRLLPVQGLLK